jgi:transposase
VHLLECGLLRGSFIPPAQIKAARDVIRSRTKLTESRTSELQRLGNVLQDAGIKVDSVAWTITTRSVRAMVEALIDGERRPLLLAELAKGRMRARIPDLQRALEGRFDDHHALMCRLHLDHLDHLEEMIARLDTQIQDMMQPFRAQRELLTTIAGIGPFAAAAIISEAGADIGETFPSAGHFASWIGVCPGNHESAGKRHSGKPERETSICSTSSSNARGPRRARQAICKACTAGTSASSAAHATRPPRTKPSSPSRTNWPSSSGTCLPPANPTQTSAPTTSTVE